MLDCRVGIGYDVHAVVGDRPLRLGGVTIPAAFGLGGHTDGDVVLHAIIDGLFGAAGLPDIGEHFPDDDPALQGSDSTELLARAVREVRKGGWHVHNIDVTVMAEHPRLSPHKADIRSALAASLDVPVDRVSVKAKTNEGFDAVGEGRAIACHAAVLLQRS